MKMRKNAVALSVAALIGGLGMVGGASAAVITAEGATRTTAVDLRVNAGGIGHSLLVPYYTAQRGNSTLINIVNTDTVNGKAVKLRFRGASNSDDVLDFQLFLSPGDVWSGNINQRADGLATINTNDNSCTLPALVSGQPFVTTRLPAALTADAKAAQTREGYVEIFNMADVHPNSSPTSLFTAIKHVNGVAPCGGALNTLGTDPTTEAQANSLGLYAPTTGLFSNFGIINQTNGATSWTSEATSIVAVNGLPGQTGEFDAGTGNIVFSPQTNAPIAGGLPAILQRTADPLLRQGIVGALNFDVPDMSTPYTRNAGGITNLSPIRQASNLSMAIATTSIRNEFLTTSSISAATDWTLSFPTRRYNIALDYVGARRVTTDFTTATGDSTDVGRVNYFDLTNTSVETSARTNNFPQICVGAGSVNTTGGTVDAAVLSFYDTSERANVNTTDFVISPGAGPRALSFCGEVTVLTFDQDATQPSRVLNAFITRNDISVPAFPGTSVKDSGWLTIATGGLGGGLPVLGSYFLKATNPANGNFSTNFGGVWSHRYQRPVAAVTTAR